MKKKNMTIVIFHFLALNSFEGEVVYFFFHIFQNAAINQGF